LLNVATAPQADSSSSTGGTSGDSTAGMKTTTSNTGATNNAPAKKLYCN
jgi:hypothetical protein